MEWTGVQWSGESVMEGSGTWLTAVGEHVRMHAGKNLC